MHRCTGWCTNAVNLLVHDNYVVLHRCVLCVWRLKTQFVVHLSCRLRVLELLRYSNRIPLTFQYVTFKSAIKFNNVYKDASTLRLVDLQIKQFIRPVNVIMCAKHTLTRYRVHRLVHRTLTPRENQSTHCLKYTLKFDCVKNFANR